MLSEQCERARAWASLRVDGELSELQSALLDTHLGRCRSCRGFARGAEDLAAALASARLERPMQLELVLPPRGRLWALGGLRWRRGQSRQPRRPPPWPVSPSTAGLRARCGRSRW